MSKWTFCFLDLWNRRGLDDDEESNCGDVSFPFLSFFLLLLYSFVVLVSTRNSRIDVVQPDSIYCDDLS